MEMIVKEKWVEEEEELLRNVFQLVAGFHNCDQANTAMNLSLTYDVGIVKVEEEVMDDEGESQQLS